MKYSKNIYALKSLLINLCFIFICLFYIWPVSAEDLTPQEIIDTLTVSGINQMSYDEIQQFMFLHVNIPDSIANAFHDRILVLQPQIPRLGKAYYSGTLPLKWPDSNKIHFPSVYDETGFSQCWNHTVVTAMKCGMNLAGLLFCRMSPIPTNQLLPVTQLSGTF